MSRRAAKVDPARRAAYRVLRQVTGADAYANLALAAELKAANLASRDAAFATELVAGTCRMLGTYDAIIATASGRDIAQLDDEVRDVLRLGAHQVLSMRVPDHAAVAASVHLARAEVGERVTGLVNAVLRKVTRRSLPEWLDSLAADADPLGAIAVRGHHPRWIAEAYAAVLPEDEVADALAANNVAPQTCLAVRPGLADLGELVGAGAQLDPLSEVGVRWPGDPATAPGVADGRVGVQDAGSQLVALAFAREPAPSGPWLDLCAGPGGKAALLCGLARHNGDDLVAAEPRPHRAQLVRQATRAYSPPPGVLCADATRPAWRSGAFARVLADVPCSGLGALRRRPEARWRRSEADVAGLKALQERILEAAIDATMPGGIIGYVTCSPHVSETDGVVDAVLAQRRGVEPVTPSLPEVPDAVDSRGRVQLWPHRHGTDAMFLALLRRY